MSRASRPIPAALAALLLSACELTPLTPRGDGGADAGVHALTLDAPTTAVKGPLAIEAQPLPADGVLEVRFFVDGAADPALRDLSTPYALTLDPAALADGSHVVRAVAEWTGGGVAEASVSVSLDNTSPALTIQAPASGARVTPPFAANVKLSVSDASGVAQATCSADSGPSVSLPPSTLTGQVALTVGAALPEAHTIACTTLDAPGNQASVTVAVMATRARMALPASQANVGVPVSQQRTLLLTSSSVDSYDPSGQREWSAPAPDGLSPVFAVRAAEGAAGVFLAGGAPGVALARLDATGAFVWQTPDAPEQRAFLALRYDEAADSFLVTTREAPAEQTQTGKLVEVSSTGAETELATLASNRVGTSIHATPAGATPEALAVETADTGGSGPDELAVYTRTGKHSWSWSPPSSSWMAAVMPLSADVVAVAISNDPSGEQSPVVVGATSSGTAWTFSPAASEKLVAGLVFPSGEIVIRGEVNGYQGALHRLRSDGTVVWEASYDQSLGCWQRLGEELAVCLGDQLRVLDAGGATAVTWTLPAEPDPLSASMLAGAYAAPDDGVYVLEQVAGLQGASSSVRLFRLDAGGEAIWSETLAGELTVDDLVPVPDDGGLLVLAGHWGEAGWAGTFYGVVP